MKILNVKNMVSGILKMDKNILNLKAVGYKNCGEEG